MPWNAIPVRFLCTQGCRSVIFAVWVTTFFTGTVQVSAQLPPPGESPTLRFPTSFPPGKYTPHGYLDNPAHSHVFNRSGVIRSVPPFGLGWWKVPFPGPYGSGVRDHLNYISALQFGVVIDDEAFAEQADFDRRGVELTSSYHTCNVISCGWEFNGIAVRFSFALTNEHALVCLVEVRNDSSAAREIFLHATHIYQLGDLRWWGRDGLTAKYDQSARASIVKAWAYGDVFTLGAAVAAAAHKTTASRSQWLSWVKENSLESVKPEPLIGRGPLWTVNTYRVSLKPHESRSILVALCRGKNEQWALSELDSALGSALAAMHQKLREDDAFWSRCPILDGNWPDTFKRGWVYDFETLRMNVRSPIGIFKHPWDGMQVQSPRVVLGEASLDMMTLGYADPVLAQQVLYGTFADALAPNVPCAREDGSMNMISSDGSECGTAPMWGYPFHLIYALFQQTGDKDWIRALYPYLKAYIEWWLEHRTDKDGWLHCNNSWESGQDGSRRFIVTETHEGAVSDFVRAVDVEASMAEAMNVMAVLAHCLDKQQDAEYWKQLAVHRTDNVHQMFFDGSFRDVDGRNGTPIILEDYLDVMMLTPLTCRIATPAQTQAVKPMFRYFKEHRERLEWPPILLTYTEAAWFAGERAIAAEAVAEIAARTYRRTDDRNVRFADTSDYFSYRVPGVAYEYWPSRDVPEGGENYGWGATLPMFIIRSIVGFREHPSVLEKAFYLAPAIPFDFMKRGKKYTIRKLKFRASEFDVTYSVLDHGQLKLIVESASTDLSSWRITDEAGKTLKVSKSKDREKHRLTLAVRNGEVLLVNVN